jgi:uncharacterized protein (DUF1697 family)
MLSHIALLRGVNVGRGNRVAMADLRAVTESLGHTRARTLLNSGNLLFDAEPAPDHAARLEAAFRERLGLRSRVTVLSAADLAAIIAENPLAEVVDQPSRLLVSVFRDPAAAMRLEPLSRQDWGPERLVLTSRAAYAWHPDGISSGELAEAVDRAGKDLVTGRNWATLLKLLAAALS